MKTSLGLGLSHSRAVLSNPAGPTITVAGSIDVSTFKIGITQTITQGTATATGGGTVSYEFRHLSDGEVKSTSAAYAHVAGDDTESGNAQWRAVETGGTNAGSTSWQSVASGTITYPAPVAAGSLSDQSFTEDTGSQTYDASGDFTGSDITYSLTTSLTGITINSSTGVVSFDTDVLAIQSGTSVIVRATNSGGPDDSGFSLAITAAAATAPSAFVDANWSVAQGTGVGELDITIASLPSNGGSAITDIEYDLDASGTWVSLGTATTGTETVTMAAANQSYAVRLRAVNSVGNASAGNSESATSKEPTITGYSFNGTDTITLTTNGAGTLYTSTTVASETDGADIENGVLAIDTDTDVITSGSNNITISYPNTFDDNYLNVVFKALGAYSNVESNQYTFGDIVPRAFVDADWSVATGSSANELDITIASLPSNGGATITDIDYDIDASGTWISLGGASGPFTITMGAPATSYAIRLRGVNSVGDGLTGNSESATSGASGDVTAPNLSSATDATNGQTTSTGSISTDEGNGTLYRVITTSGTAPTAAQVKLGQDNSGSAATDSGSQSVSATGVQNITGSGLTAATAYTTHFMHEDASGNQSSVASASGFTTAAGGFAHYDASDSGTITDTSGEVDQLDDKANSNDLTSTGTARPTTGTVTIGGLNAIDFDGSDDLLSNTSVTDIGNGNAAITIVGVVKVRTGYSGFGTIALYGNNGSGTLFAASQASNSSDEITARYGNGYAESDDIWSNGDDVLFVQEKAASANHTATDFYINGTSTGVTTANSNSMSLSGTKEIWMGSYFDSAGDGYADMAIGELVFFDRVLSQSEREEEEGRLAHKWGLEGSLPGGHPYKSTAP